jgi:N-acetylmuramic acid 6-phosphate etherase
MVKLGKVYGNLMVDLTAVNQKLIDRAQRIVMEVTGVDRDKARITLEQADYKVKNALLMILGNTDYTESLSLLKQHDGVLADALESVDN